jgi:hypothetical protein|eukprot:COSAG01_NODE_479_length_16475_cov_4.851979_6_plen_40_part_00
MELATGSPMEEHYDLQAHDELMAEIEDASHTEQVTGDSA